MNRSDIKIWHLYFAPNCRHAKPSPKDKYVVVVTIDQNPMGFFINTRISQWIQNRPHLLVCEAIISASEHHILKYDSYVDCQTIYEFYDSDLTRRFEEVSPQAKKAILKAIRDCLTIERKYKTMILASEKELLDKIEKEDTNDED